MNAMKKLGVVALAVAGLGGTALAVEAQTQPERRARMERFDANQDGALDEAERKAMRAEREAKFEERLAKYDANRDGKLDDEERARAHAERSAEHFKQLDANQDGVLSLEEFQAGMKLRGGPHGRRGAR